MVPGHSVYGERRVTVTEGGVKQEYRTWNPFRSKLAAAILGGVDQIHIKPKSKVLYLGAASGTTVSHVSDIIGPDGLVYAVEFSHRAGRDLVNVAKKRTNIIPVLEDARHPLKYRMLIGMVDVIFADVAQPDQSRIVALNAHTFLRNGGHFLISIKANCIDSTASAEAVFASEVRKLQQENLKPQEQLTLEPYERDHAVVVGVYRPLPKSGGNTPCGACIAGHHSESSDSETNAREYSESVLLNYYVHLTRNKTIQEGEKKITLEKYGGLCRGSHGGAAASLCYPMTMGLNMGHKVT
ncbi:hypothetical protein GH733_005000 [Mirounga leonina]|nr:hypothetical protein GH733_005000 [Mirounga leonina]